LVFEARSFDLPGLKSPTAEEFSNRGRWINIAGVTWSVVVVDVDANPCDRLEAARFDAALPKENIKRLAGFRQAVVNERDM
jgi:hypothetical protein